MQDGDSLLRVSRPVASLTSPAPLVNADWPCATPPLSNSSPRAVCRQGRDKTRPLFPFVLCRSARNLASLGSEVNDIMGVAVQLEWSTWVESAFERLAFVSGEENKTSFER